MRKGIGLRRPVSLLGHLVPQVSSVIATRAHLVPQRCVVVSLSPVPIAVRRHDVAFAGIVISMPG